MSHATSADDEADFRVGGRLGGWFCLDTVTRIVAMADLDLVETLTYFALVCENARAGGGGTIDPFCGDSAPMAPSSVYAVRRILQSPYETVRRHILRLEAHGYCHRTGDGVLADLRVFGTPEIVRSRAMAWEKTNALREELVALGVSVPELPAHPTDRMKETNCRLAVEFLLTMIPAATGGTGLDLTPLLIFLTVHRENLRHLDIGMPEHRRILGERGSPFDDKVRTPVSTYRVAAALKLPYETTRRHALVLVEHGLCSRDSSGRLMVTAEAARSPGVSSATRAVWQLTRSYLDAVSRLSDERPQAALSA